jgi:hypothetical protein
MLNNSIEPLLGQFPLASLFSQVIEVNVTGRTSP